MSDTYGELRAAINRALDTRIQSDIERLAKAIDERIATFIGNHERNKSLENRVYALEAERNDGAWRPNAINGKSIHEWKKAFDDARDAIAELEKQLATRKSQHESCLARILELETELETAGKVIETQRKTIEEHNKTCPGGKLISAHVSWFVRVIQGTKDGKKTITNLYEFAAESVAREELERFKVAMPWAAFEVWGESTHEFVAPSHSAASSSSSSSG